MEKWRPQFSIGYFVIAIVTLIALQSFFAPSRQETVAYSEFKALVKKGLVTNLVVTEKSVHGDIRSEGIQEAIPFERLKLLGDEYKNGKKLLPFVTVRVEDPELIAGQERSGIAFKGEVASDWVPTILSWVVPVALFFLLWSWLFKKMGTGGGVMQIGKSKAKVYIEEKTGVTFFSPLTVPAYLVA